MWYSPKITLINTLGWAFGSLPSLLKTAPLWLFSMLMFILNRLKKFPAIPQKKTSYDMLKNFFLELLCYELPLYVPDLGHGKIQKTNRPTF